MKKVAIITGGSGGIGLAAAKRLSEAGFQLMLSGRNEERLKQAQAQLPGSEIFAKDLTKEKAIEALFVRTHSAFGRVDVLIHAAEDFQSGLLTKLEDENTAALLSTIRTTVELNKQALEYMAETGGVVVDISSRAGILDDILPESAAYAASKMVMSAIVRAANQEQKQVKLFALCLGAVNTRMGREAAEKRGLAFDPSAVLDPAEVAEKIADLVLTPEQFANDVFRLDKALGFQVVGSSFGDA